MRDNRTQQSALVRARREKQQMFIKLRKTNHRKKHITSLIINDDNKITNPKDIFEEEERFLDKYIRQQILTQIALMLMSSLKPKMHYQKRWRKLA